MSLESMKRKLVLLQFTVIILMSAAASYAFKHTQSTYQINGLCFYRYIVYLITVFLGYVCFARFKKYIALTFSFSLLAVALSPIGQRAIEFFPLVVPFLAVLMGVTTVLIVPSSRGRGFFEFLVVLILPAVLAESRIGGSFHLLATTESIGYFELSLVTVSIVGGYFYIRYSALANLRSIELLSNGGNEKDVAKVSRWCNIMIILIVVSASRIAMFSMVTAPIVADALRATVAALPLYVLTLAMGTGIAITTILYIFQRTHEEKPHVHTR
jgi:hypothetical protein